MYYTNEIKQIDMKNLETQIKELKAGRTLAQLKKEDRKAYYKVQNLSTQLSELKAREKGQFITVEHLKEFKGLIIWAMNKKANFRNLLDLKEAMGSLLNKVENKELVYKTEKGIKSLLVNVSTSLGLENVEYNLRKAYGLDCFDSSLNNPILEQFTQHRLNTLMN